MKSQQECITMIREFNKEFATKEGQDQFYTCIDSISINNVKEKEFYGAVSLASILVFFVAITYLIVKKL